MSLRELLPTERQRRRKAACSARWRLWWRCRTARSSCGACGHARSPPAARRLSVVRMALNDSAVYASTAGLSCCSSSTSWPPCDHFSSSSRSLLLLDSACSLASRPGCSCSSFMLCPLVSLRRPVPVFGTRNLRERDRVRLLSRRVGSVNSCQPIKDAHPVRSIVSPPAPAALTRRGTVPAAPRPDPPRTTAR